jgi:hypothetical protein
VGVVLGSGKSVIFHRFVRHTIENFDRLCWDQLFLHHTAKNSDVGYFLAEIN